jgi:hypothetical protein
VVVVDKDTFTIPAVGKAIPFVADKSVTGTVVEANLVTSVA